MNPARLSLLFLTVAAATGSLALGLPEKFGLSEVWLPDARWAGGLCVGALAAFLVSFLVGLDRSALVRR